MVRVGKWALTGTETWLMLMDVAGCLSVVPGAAASGVLPLLHSPDASCSQGPEVSRLLRQELAARSVTVSSRATRLVSQQLARTVAWTGWPLFLQLWTGGGSRG